MRSQVSSRPPIELAQAGTAESVRTRSLAWEALWMAAQALLVSSSQPSSSIRGLALRMFGAEVASGVIMRRGLRVKYPWKLRIGRNCWLGEDVWIHNQAEFVVEDNVVISQGCFVTTGTHDTQVDMALVVAPVRIRRGAWLTSRVVVTPGVDIGENSIVTPGSVVHKSVPADSVVGGNPARFLKPRWRMSDGDSEQ